MRRQPDDVQAALVGGGAIPPLASVAELRAHASLGDAYTDADLTEKLGAATALIEGLDGRCRRWFRPVTVTAKWYAMCYADTLALVGGLPDDATVRVSAGQGSAF